MAPTTAELTDAEAAELAEVILFATFNSTSVLPARPASPPGAAWGLEFEAEVRCPAGGKVAMAASLVVLETEDRAAYELVQIHDDCSAQPVDRRFSVAGAPRVVADLVVRHGADAVAWEGTTEGEIEWRTAEGVGRCAFQLSFQGEHPEGAAAVAILDGSMCGHVIDHSMTIS